MRIYHTQLDDDESNGFTIHHYAGAKLVKFLFTGEAPVKRIVFTVQLPDEIDHATTLQQVEWASRSLQDYARFSLIAQVAMEETTKFLENNLFDFEKDSLDF